MTDQTAAPADAGGALSEEEEIAALRQAAEASDRPGRPWFEGRRRTINGPIIEVWEESDTLFVIEASPRRVVGVLDLLAAARTEAELYRTRWTYASENVTDLIVERDQAREEARLAQIEVVAVRKNFVAQVRSTRLQREDRDAATARVRELEIDRDLWHGESFARGVQLDAAQARAVGLEAFARRQRPLHEPLCQEYVDKGSTCHCGAGEDMEYFDAELAAALASSAAAGVGGAILPVLEPIEGLTLDHPLDVLTPEEKARVRGELEQLARNRRASEASAASVQIGAAHHPDCGIHEIGRCTSGCGEGES